MYSIVMTKTKTDEYLQNAWKTHHPVQVIEQYNHAVFESTKRSDTRIMYNTPKFDQNTTMLVLTCLYIDDDEQLGYKVQRLHTITIEGNRDELNQLRWYLYNDPRLNIDDMYIYPEY